MPSQLIPISRRSVAPETFPLAELSHESCSISPCGSSGLCPHSSASALASPLFNYGGCTLQKDATGTEMTNHRSGHDPRLPFCYGLARTAPLHLPISCISFRGGRQAARTLCEETEQLKNSSFYTTPSMIKKW